MASDITLGFDINPGGTNLFIVQFVFLFASWVVCGLRAYVKICINRKIGQDDWWMLLGLLCYTAMAGIVLLACVQGGVGMHLDDLPSGKTFIIGLQGWYFSEILYAPASLAARTSIAVFLLRLAVARWHKIVIFTCLVASWIVTLAWLGIMIMQCNPPSFFWEKYMGGKGECLPLTVVPISSIVLCVICALCDWIVGLLPIAMLWNVKINGRTKWGIAGLLGMGLIAGVGLVIRIPFIVPTIWDQSDFLAQSINIAIWSALEPALGIMAGSIATLRPLFKSIGFGISTSKKQSQYPTGNSSRGWPGSRVGSRVSKGAIKLQSSEVNNHNGNYFNDNDIHVDTEVQLHEMKASPRHMPKASYGSHWDVEAGHNGRDWHKTNASIHSSAGHSSSSRSDHKISPSQTSMPPHRW